MNDRKNRPLERCLLLLAGLAAVLFVPAWTVHYWQAWIFLTVFSLSLLAQAIFLKLKNPQLLELRLNTSARSELRPRQKVLHFIMSKALIATVGLSTIDHRWEWSTVPPYVTAVGDVLVVAGFVIVTLAFNENTFAYATVEIQNRQSTISTGPYALVRHPMYGGWLLTFIGVPLALGSWWGLLTIIPFALVITLRLLDEEMLLNKSLPGYSAYAKRVRFRLVPFVW